MLADAARRTSAATVAALNRQRAAGTPPRHSLERGSGGEVDHFRLLTLENAQLKRELAAALSEISRLTDEADTFAARAHAKRQYDTRHSALGNSALLHEGREVVNQTEAARQLNVKQYQISRWVAAGHFQTVRVGSRTLIYADTLHKPAPKQRKRKGVS